MGPHRSFWMTSLLAAVTAMGSLLGAQVTLGNDREPGVRSGRVSDDEPSEPKANTSATSFQLSDPGPITGPPRVPPDLPEIPSQVPDVPSRSPALNPPPLAAARDVGQVACESRMVACQPCEAACPEGWLANSLVFISGDGWKNIFDDDDNNNFGFRAGFNLGIDLPGDHAVRGQAGMSYGAYDFHGREELLSRDDPIEQQIFATAGIFKRSDVAAGDALAWGAVYDLLVADEAGERADSLRLGQVRSYVGWAISERDELGVWAALRIMNDHATRQNVRVNSTDQANLFWHHNWSSGGDTMAYVGWADDPGSVVIGLHGQVPLNNRTALFGSVHYIVPSTTGGDIHPTLGVDDVFSQEAWNVSFGIMFFTRPKAAATTVSGRQGIPLLPVADNGSFSYQAGMF